MVLSVINFCCLFSKLNLSLLFLLFHIMAREAKKDDANVQTSKDKRTLVTGTTGFAHDAFWRAGAALLKKNY